MQLNLGNSKDLFRSTTIRSKMIQIKVISNRGRFLIKKAIYMYSKLYDTFSVEEHAFFMEVLNKEGNTRIAQAPRSHWASRG